MIPGPGSWMSLSDYAGLIFLPEVVVIGRISDDVFNRNLLFFPKRAYRLPLPSGRHRTIAWTTEETPPPW